jgi:hypothetical protein
MPGEAVSKETRCAHCAETVHPAALKCKHCRSYLVPRELPHRGECPFCRETIKPEARVCRHCGSGVVSLVDGSIFSSPQVTSRARMRGGSHGRFGRFGLGVEKCISVPVIKCWEEPNPIAGYDWHCTVEYVEVCWLA